MYNNFEEQVHSIIKNIANIDENITNETNLIEDLGLSSIEMMEMVYQFEEKFNIMFSFDDLDIEKISIIENLIKVISTKLKNKI